MTIPVILEPVEVRQEFGGIVESCVFCWSPTRYWHLNTNNPVCLFCSRRHRVSELPDHGKKIRAAKRRAKRDV